VQTGSKSVLSTSALHVRSHAYCVSRVPAYAFIMLRHPTPLPSPFPPSSSGLLVSSPHASSGGSTVSRPGPVTTPSASSTALPRQAPWPFRAWMRDCSALSDRVAPASRVVLQCVKASRRAELEVEMMQVAIPILALPALHTARVCTHCFQRPPTQHLLRRRRHVTSVA